MARVVKPRKQRIAPSTPLQAMLEEYIESLAVKGFTDDTQHVRREHLSLFERWAQERGLSDPVEITRPVLERYQRYLFHYRKKDGQPLSFASQHSRLSPLRSWFRWMTRQNYLLHNPASEIELPRFSRCHLSYAVRLRIDAAKLGKTGSCHLFRHTMATLMHENGADIRFIQQMLGHEDLKSTQIYTQVAIRTLQQVHAATHPAATLEGHPANFPPVPKLSGPEQPGPGAEQAAEALLAALEAEAEEEQQEPDE